MRPALGWAGLGVAVEESGFDPGWSVRVYMFVGVRVCVSVEVTPASVTMRQLRFYISRPFSSHECVLLRIHLYNTPSSY